MTVHSLYVNRPLVSLEFHPNLILVGSFQ